MQWHLDNQFKPQNKLSKKFGETSFIGVPSFVVAGFTLCFGVTGTVEKKKYSKMVK